MSDVSEFSRHHRPQALPCRNVDDRTAISNARNAIHVARFVCTYVTFDSNSWLFSSFTVFSFFSFFLSFFFLYLSKYIHPRFMETQFLRKNDITDTTSVTLAILMLISRNDLFSCDSRASLNSCAWRETTYEAKYIRVRDRGCTKNPDKKFSGLQHLGKEWIPSIIMTGRICRRSVSRASIFKVWTFAFERISILFFFLFALVRRAKEINISCASFLRFVPR